MKPDAALDPATGKPAQKKPTGKWQKWLQTHKPEAALGVGAVGAVGIALYRRSSGGSADTSGTTSSVPATMTSGTPDGSTAGGVTYGGDPASDYGNYDAVGVAAALTSSLNGLTTTDARGFSSIKRLIKKNANPTPAKGHGGKKGGGTKKGGGKKVTQGPIRKVNHPTKGKATPKPAKGHPGKKK